MTREEAINEVRTWAISSKKGREVLETLIPELRESEDERIRKALIGGVRQIRCENGGITQEQMVTYLEKKKVIELEQLEKLREMTHEIREAYERGIEVGRARSKQEWSEEEAPDETKQEWGSVDIPGSIKTSRIETLKNIISYFKYERKATQEEIRISFIPCLENLLEEIELKPAEWSEEDKEIMHDIIKYHYDQGEISSKHNKWASWLEHKYFSLQPHWKPSEEQMKALCSKLPVVKGRGDKVQDILETLYYDLKKLM